jgi:hypothetical protein
MNEQPLATLLKTFPHTRHHPEWRLLTWHPRGLFDDALADKLIEVIGSEERVEKVPFHRYADFSGLTHIRLKVGHVFDVAKLRRGVSELVKSAFFSDTTVGLGIARMYEALMERRRFKCALSGSAQRQRSGSVCRWKSSSLMRDETESQAVLRDYWH